MKLLYSQETKGCRQETVIVKQVELNDGLLTADILSELTLMPEPMKEMYYPYENRPEMIWANKDGKVQMTFQMLNKGLTEKETGNAAEAIRECTEKLYPHNKISPVHMFYEGNIHIGWFVMEMEQDGELFCHVKAAFPIHGQLFLTTATYSEQEQSKWGAILKHYFVTLRERSGTE